MIHPVNTSAVANASRGDEAIVLHIVSIKSKCAMHCARNPARHN